MLSAGLDFVARHAKRFIAWHERRQKQEDTAMARRIYEAACQLLDSQTVQFSEHLDQELPMHAAASELIDFQKKSPGLTLVHGRQLRQHETEQQTGE